MYENAGHDEKCAIIQRVHFIGCHQQVLSSYKVQNFQNRNSCSRTRHCCGWNESTLEKQSALTCRQLSMVLIRDVGWTATGGLLFYQSASNLQYASTTAFLMMTYAKHLSSSSSMLICGSTAVDPSRLTAMAKQQVTYHRSRSFSSREIIIVMSNCFVSFHRYSICLMNRKIPLINSSLRSEPWRILTQVDYILGNNPLKKSYMVGFGSNYPLHVHHRASSLPSLRFYPSVIRCGDGWSWYSSSNPNPNLLVGAVVGGPDNADRFNDARAEYMALEPAMYINAPLVGMLAMLANSTGWVVTVVQAEVATVQIFVS